MPKSKLILLAGTATLVIAAPIIASAQTVTNDKVETVVVTARKRSEDILKVPETITAFTANDLSARNILTLSDLANFTPGLEDNISTAGGARVDRSSESFIIRGMNPANSLISTTSVFLNGVPVAAADFLANLDDVDHVEVLEGPQSAYFGRDTFAGAINVTAKSAGNTLTGDMNAEVATRDTYHFAGSITVPLIDNVLSVRAGYYYDTHSGSYKNADNPGQTLGDQSTSGYHVAATLRPIQNLTIKAFGMIFQDKDGPEATGVLLADGPAPFNQANCKINTTGANNYFCGTLPGVISGVTPAEVTTITAAQQAFFTNPGGLIRASQIIHGYGLKRDAYHGDLNAEYVIPQYGLTLTYLGGFNHDNYSSVSDLANLDGLATGNSPGYAGYPFLVEQKNHDYSDEVRITTDQNKPLRALLGASFFDFYHNAISYGLGGAPIPPAPFGAAATGKTTGIFFSLAYDILPPLTLTFDGRFQSDTEASLTTTGATAARGTSHDFLPRVSLQYKITPNIMAYATYSQGVDAPQFNTTFNALPPVSQQELISNGAAGTLVVKPEELTNYELGAKARFWNGRATLSADIYYDDWTNAINPGVYNFAINDPANPYKIVGSSTYNAAQAGTSIYPYLSNNNSASIHAKGFEVQGNLIPIEHVALNFSGAINDARYSSYICTNCAPYSTAIATAPNVSGSYLPNAPKYSGTVGAQYSNNFSYLAGADWFVRGDYVYRDGVYIQSSNTAKTPSIDLVNIRGGINWRNITFEGFVNNLFNDKAYTAGFQDYDFKNFATAVYVGLPTLITGGVRIKYKY